MLLDRDDAATISDEDIRRAKALAAEVSVVLEATQNLQTRLKIANAPRT